jgi:hypothetical protein
VLGAVAPMFLPHRSPEGRPRGTARRGPRIPFADRLRGPRDRPPCRFFLRPNGWPRGPAMSPPRWPKPHISGEIIATKPLRAGPGRGPTIAPAGLRVAGRVKMIFDTALGPA